MLALLACVLFGSSSCVYWRLNKFRKQLAEFSEYCAIEHREGPTVVFNRPVLEPGDLQWLVGIEPNQTETVGDSLMETYLFRKMYADGNSNGEERGKFDFPVQIAYQDGRLRDIMFPARIRELIHEKQMNELFKEIHKADLEAKDHVTSWNLGDSLDVPNFSAMRSFVGRSFRDETNDLHRIVHLRYQVADKVDLKGPVHTEAKLVYNRENGNLVWIDIRMGYLYIHANVGRGKEDTVTMKRVVKKE